MTSMGELTRWFAIELGDATIASLVLYQRQTQLDAVYRQSGSPDNMTAVYCYQSHDVHCHIRLFLSDALQRTIKLKGAYRAVLPDRVTHLAGVNFQGAPPTS